MKHPIMVLGFQSCPFVISKIEVETQIELRERVVVEIALTDGRILTPSATSSLPFLITEAGVHAPCIGCKNLQIKFLKAGLEFISGSSTYMTTKAGATISFTEEGVRLDGVSKKR